MSFSYDVISFALFLYDIKLLGGGVLTESFFDFKADLSDLAGGD